MKYVILQGEMESFNADRFYPFIFPEYLVHADVVDYMRHLLGMKERVSAKVASAGFCLINDGAEWTATTGSESIGIAKSEERSKQDSIILNMPEALQGMDLGIPLPADPRKEKRKPFQSRVEPWLNATFGQEISNDKAERNHRFLEESLELVQSTGCSAWEAHQLVDYVFNRPAGDPPQEVGGVMVTLAALCLANGLDMSDAGEKELARIWAKIDQIRSKQAAKPKHSPLPEEVINKHPISCKEKFKRPDPTIIGLYDKFRVERRDGSSAKGGKHENCNYFVLDTIHDPYAAKALAVYMDQARCSHPCLVQDMIREYGVSPDQCTCPLHGDWIAEDDVNRMVKEIDTAINGSKGAKAPKLCDVTPQVIKRCDDLRKLKES